MPCSDLLEMSDITLRFDLHVELPLNSEKSTGNVMSSVLDAPSLEQLALTGLKHSVETISSCSKTALTLLSCRASR